MRFQALQQQEKRLRLLPGYDWFTVLRIGNFSELGDVGQDLREFCCLAGLASLTRSIGNSKEPDARAGVSDAGIDEIDFLAAGNCGKGQKLQTIADGADRIN